MILQVALIAAIAACAIGGAPGFAVVFSIILFFTLVGDR